MFRRYPYWGWVIISILLWAAACMRFYAHRQALLPGKMTREVTRDVQKRELALDKTIADKKLVQRIFSGSLDEDDVTDLQAKPFYLFACENDALKFWSTNAVTILCNAPDTGHGILHALQGVYVQKIFRLDSARKLIALIPLMLQYSIENDYLHSHFAAADYIPVTTQILDSPSAAAYTVYGLHNKPLCYLKYHSQDIQQWIPDWLMLLFVIAAMFTTVTWLQLIAIYLCDNKTYLYGLAFTVAVIIIGRGLNYLLGLPFNIGSLTFFSPSLYASSMLLPSLGDLLLNTLCILWIVVYVIRHTPYESLCARVTKPFSRYVLAFAFILLLLVFIAGIPGVKNNMGFVSLVRSLVIDSNISFDVSHFYAINVYTIIGLFIIAIITGISCLIVYLVNYQLNVLLRNKWIKYAGISLLGLLYAFIFTTDVWLMCFIMVWALILIALLDNKKYTLISDIFEPHVVFWAIYICVFSTVLLQYFNHIKEGEARKIFAEQRAEPERDMLMEYAFKKADEKIQKDNAIKNYLQKPEQAKRKLINERFDVLYMTGELNKYEARIYLFDSAGKPLFNKDTLSFKSLGRQKEMSVSTSAIALYYNDFLQDKPYYLAYIPIYKNNGSLLGYIYANLELKRGGNETLYPELLQSSGARSGQSPPPYPYAIYVNGKMISQNTDYPFPIYISANNQPVNSFTFRNRGDASELLYKSADNRLIIVVHQHNIIIEVITLFSYLFGIEVLLGIVVLLYQLYLSSVINLKRKNRFTTLTLRKRIHFSMLSVVLISFLIIGFVTVAFFISEYKSSNKTRLISAIQTVQQSVEEYLKQTNALSNEQLFDSAVHATSRFKTFIYNLSASQKIDINVYDTYGNLEATSQDDIYDRSLLARIIRPDAWYKLTTEGKSIIIQREKIGQLSYLSGYVPVKSEYGTPLGYINIPFFSSEHDLNFQISNIVVTLINLYAFIFLISGILTVIITQWLTRSFNLIISQFGRLNLQRNERIQWPYNDEIGLLVREYNKMVNKVEQNAAILARSERESAWREMARQVAHEIKNPLTPMKLNIQYLQQALNNDHPDIKKLVNRVAGSLVEQIDNLSYIASEFSNFAKMPEARPEQIDLNELTDKATELYLDDKRVKVTVQKCRESLIAYADRSQLLRVLTNLLENAHQAIPEGREGRIWIRIDKDEHNNALISIADNGVGISAEVQERIFQPYFTTKSSGTGLGLAMTKKIIEFWRGDIWFETIENEGTTFFIRLPLS